jgi:hypothetical protein
MVVASEIIEKNQVPFQHAARRLLLLEPQCFWRLDAGRIDE